MSKALILAGKLKPEARLGVALSEFAEVLDDKHRKKFIAMRAKSTAPPSAEDVIKVTEELNRDGARLHRTWRPYSTRVGAFLSRLQSLAGIGDVAIGGSQNLMISGVWCAARMCLEVTIGFITYFDKITTMFMNMGTSWSLHRDFAQLFPRSQELQIFLTEYLIVIVTLCKKAVIFGNKSGLSQFATSLVSSFKSNFDPLLSELDQWARLIEQKANLLATESSLNAETGAVERSMNLARRLSSSGRRQRNFDMKQRLLLLLCPDQPEFELQWRRQRRKGTCYWIFDTPEYKNWRQGQEQLSSSLWVWGSLGSGKTVMLANIVADVHLRQRALFFFCTSKVAGSLKARNIIGSLAYQLFNSIPIEQSFWTSLNLDDVSSKALTSEGIVELLLVAIPKEERLCIILDGLEESDDEDITDVLYFLKLLMDARCVHFCCSSRPESVLHAQYSGSIRTDRVLTVTMKSQARDEEIEKFICAEIERRTADRPLDPDLESLMKSQLVSGSQGMYLWVVLQLEVMLPAYSGTIVSPKDIRAVLENLPRDLPEAFDHALGRIREKRYRNQLFKLVTVAERPLGLDEMRVAMTVVPGETTWHPEKLPPDGASIVHLCGGNLVEIDEEDQKIYFIHHSALLHLLQPPTRPETAMYHFSLDDAEIEMGCICIAYLSYGIFDNRVAIQRKIETTQVADTVVRATTASNPMIGRIARHFVSRQRGSSPSLDIGRVAHELLAVNSKKPDVPRSFLPYTTTFWLEHTRRFDTGMDSRVWASWRSLVEGELQHVKVPWHPVSDKDEILAWAIRNSHGALFQYFVHEHPVFVEDVNAILRLTDGDPNRLGIGGHWLDDIIAQCLGLRMWESNVLNFFLEAGANPTRPHHLTGMSPLQILITTDWMPSSRRESLLHRFLSNDAVKEWARISDIGDLLLAAINKGYTDAALSLVRMKPVFDKLGMTYEDSPLGAAVSIGHRELSMELLKRGCHPSKSYFGGKRAIQLAFEAQHFDVLELMVRPKPGEVHTAMSDGTTMLYSAVLWRSHDAVSHLLRLGANPDLASPMRHGGPTESSPLQLAIKLKAESIVRLLLEQGASSIFNTPRGGISALHTAFRLYSCDSPTTKPTKAQLSIIHLLLQDTQQLSSQSLMTPDGSGNTVLHYASQWGQVSIQVLLDAGADVSLSNSNGVTALHLAATRFRASWRSADIMENVVIPLLKAGAVTDARDNNGVCSLQIASSSNDSRLLETLIFHGGDPNTKTSRGSTLLHLAVEKSCSPAMRFLLKRNVDVSLTDSSGHTPLDVAIRRGSTESVGMLLKKGATLTDTSSAPLIRAVEGIHLEAASSAMVEFLLKAGAEPDWTNTGGSVLEAFLSRMSDGPPSDISRMLVRRQRQSLRFRDVKNELMDSVMALIEAGADPNTVTFGVPVLNYALQHNWARFALRLLVKGANPSTVSRKFFEDTILPIAEKVLITRDEQRVWDNITFRLTGKRPKEPVEGEALDAWVLPH